MNRIKCLKEYKKQIFILLLSIVIIVVYQIFFKEDINLYRIKRGLYGELGKEHIFHIEGVNEKDIEINLEVQSRRYKEEELSQVFAECKRILDKEILADNKSFSEIYTDLKFPTYIADYAVEIMIEAENSELISYTGKVFNEDLKEKVDTKLNISLLIDNKKYQYETLLSIYPLNKSKEEIVRKELKRYLIEEDKKQDTNEYFELPKKWNDLNLKYKKNKDNTVIYILIFASIISVLLYFMDKEKIKKKKEEDKNLAIIEYPEVVSKFIVFLEAGLSTRNIWDKLINDYEKRENKEKIFVYEEMKKANIKIRAGVSESLAYKDFARSIGLRQYTKFISILEQNKRNGLSNIKEILNLECKLAFEERLNLAKRKGSELGTKLLLPVFIMLLIVLFVVLAPAILNTY